MMDKRRDPRFDSLLLMHLEIFDGDTVVGRGMGRTIDISRSGVRLETRFSISNETPLISVAIGVKNKIIEIKGKIVHSSMPESGVYQYGIEFIKPDHKTLKILDAYIKAFKIQKNVGAPESE